MAGGWAEAGARPDTGELIQLDDDGPRLLAFGRELTGGRVRLAGVTLLSGWPLLVGGERAGDNPGVAADAWLVAPLP